MATAKKSSKKPAVKRAPSKAASTTKVTRKVAPKEEMRSFRATRPSQFFTFRVTKQTLYWSLLCAIVFALGVWVLSISVQVNNIYDQIDATNRTLDELK